jgi:hypothetical protein
MTPVEIVYIPKFLINKAEIHSQSFSSKHVISTFLFLRANRPQNYRKEEEKEEHDHHPASSQRGGAVTSPLPFTGTVPGDAPL